MSNQTTRTGPGASSDQQGETAVLDELGIDREAIEDRKQFVRFDETDAARLADIEPILESIEGDAVDEFYDHLQDHPETAAIVGESDRTVEELERLQSQYIRDLGRGTYDRSYFERRARIGKTHEKIGLEPKFYLGSYSIHYEHLLDGITTAAVERILEEYDVGEADDAPVSETEATRFESALRDAATEIEARASSVLKLLLLDQQIAIDTYVEQYAELEAEMERREAVATDVKRSVNQLESGANVVEHSARQIGEITDEQVEAVQAVSSQLSDLSATVEEIAASADEVNATSEEAERVADEGATAAEDALEEIDDLEDAASNVSRDVEQLQESVEEIDQLADVIDDIASQTNLLALNASIEAANAGEAGDGFAVVADEVKTLAEESQTQAENIKQTIERIREDTKETTASIEKANAHVETSAERVNRTVETLDRILEAVEEVSTGIEGVADATDDQAASTEEVSSSIDQIAGDVETIADKVDEVVTVVDEQTERTASIDESVEQLIEDR